MELWDAYDGQGNKTGGELIRGQEIPEGTRRRWIPQEGETILFLVDNCAGNFEFGGTQRSDVWTQRERMKGIWMS